MGYECAGCSLSEHDLPAGTTPGSVFITHGGYVYCEICLPAAAEETLL